MISFQDNSKKSGQSAPEKRLEGAQWLYAVLVIALTYFASSRLGFAVAFSAEQVTAVWPPTGLALAAVLLWGDRMLPGILLGAFLANITRHEPSLTAVSIATGNTLEAWIAASMMRRFTGFSVSLAGIRDVVSLIAFSAVCGTMVSANIGVLSLCASSIHPWTSYRPLWLLWWLGDATGALIIAPALLVWATEKSKRLTPGKRYEFSALCIGLIVCCVTLFSQALEEDIRGQIFLYLLFAFVIWGALRFGQRGTTLVTLVSSCIALWFAAHGRGLFISRSIDQSVILLQLFMGVVAMTGLFLGAAISERMHMLALLALADRRKNEFLAMLAHELRNPLATLGNALHLLKAQDAPKSNTQETLRIMGRQLEQINRLVDDLLDAARIAHGKIELRRAPAPLAQILAAALETAKPLLQSCGHRCSVRLPEKHILLDADADRLVQVFVNLMTNAAKYTPPGGRIAIDTVIEAQTAIVRISDNGIGIPPSLLPRIFDLFMQADYTIERSQGGLGIGLTLVKKLVELHGGAVSAHSAGSFKGSEFRVCLPLAASVAVPTESVKAAATAD